MSTIQAMTTKELAEELGRLLPEPVDYAELVGAEGFAHGSCFVYEDPNDYVVEEAAHRLNNLGRTIVRLSGKLADAKETLDAAESCLAMVSDGVNDIAAKRLRYVLTRLRELTEECADEAARQGYDKLDVEPLPF